MGKQIVQRAKLANTQAMGTMLGQQAIHSAGVLQKAWRAGDPESHTCYRIQLVQNAADSLQNVIAAVQDTKEAQPWTIANDGMVFPLALQNELARVEVVQGKMNGQAEVWAAMGYYEELPIFLHSCCKTLAKVQDGIDSYLEHTFSDPWGGFNHE